MGCRGFYNSKDGDHFPIDFNYPEEQHAFEVALQKLTSLIPQMGMYKSCMAGMSCSSMPNPPIPGEDRQLLGLPGAVSRVSPQGHITISYRTPKGEKPLLTTLQAEQASRFSDAICQIAGLHVCNVDGRSSFSLCLFTDFIWKGGKWTTKS